MHIHTHTHTQTQVLVASVCAGFTAADIFDIGPSVTITVDTLAPQQTVVSSISSNRDVTVAGQANGEPLERSQGPQEQQLTQVSCWLKCFVEEVGQPPNGGYQRRKGRG